MASGPIHMWAPVGGGSAERAEGRSADCACGGTGWLDGGFYVWEGDVRLAADEGCLLHAT